MNHTRRGLFVLGSATLVGLLDSGPADAASARQINQSAQQALRNLYAAQPRAHELGQHAKAILVFPEIVKAGLVVGGQSGDGVLLVDGKPEAYYNISAASFGLQLGAQTFSYVLMFMTDGALKYLRDSDGWSVGSGPSVVVMDKGAAASVTSTTLTHDVYAFPFGQHGLMAGVGLEGSKITRIRPGP